MAVGQAVDVVQGARVVTAADGGLGGYAGGLERKRSLLELEGELVGEGNEPDLGFLVIQGVGHADDQFIHRRSKSVKKFLGNGLFDK